MTLAQDLTHFTGTSQYYRHPMFARHLHWTDGVDYFINNAGNGAYWFLDIVLTELVPLHLSHAFLSITLTVTGSKAVIVATDGNETTLWTKDIDFTDCPEGEYKFYLTGNVFLVRSEY